MESIYTQKKVKPNQNTHIVLVFNLLGKTKDISIYINGFIESQLSLSVDLEPPEGHFYLGSESTVRCFKGAISDMVIFFKPLPDQDIKEMALKATSKKSSVQLLKDKQDNMELTSSFSKKTGSSIKFPLIFSFAIRSAFAPAQELQGRRIRPIHSPRQSCSQADLHRGEQHQPQQHQAARLALPAAFQLPGPAARRRALRQVDRKSVV